MEFLLQNKNNLTNKSASLNYVSIFKSIHQAQISRSAFILKGG